MVMFGCLSAAVHGFTPFSAFLSTSAEWEENTHDLLVLSNLRPRQIVYGKLLSALNSPTSTAPSSATNGPASAAP
jgi:hypothetical protein